MTEQENTKVHQEFDDIIKNKLTPEQFTNWFLEWVDNGIILDIALNWTAQSKKDELEHLKEIIKNN